MDDAPDNREAAQIIADAIGDAAEIIGDAVMQYARSIERLGDALHAPCWNDPNMEPANAADGLHRIADALRALDDTKQRGGTP